MQFFKLTYDWPGTTVVAIDFEAEQFFRYVASTGLWHLEQELSNDYLFGDDGAKFIEISAEEAVALMRQAPKLDRRSPHQRHALDGYLLQLRRSPKEVKTSAEIGLTMQQNSARPTTAPNIGELIQVSGTFRTLARYGIHGDAKKPRRAADALAKSAAASLSSGKVTIETKVAQRDRGTEAPVIEVLVRKARPTTRRQPGTRLSASVGEDLGVR